ncbi:C39 family peptidase [Micromonospora sp. CPCC 205556]|uniref:C39 family peptidase n=1 Tax=Micromonospora sp. CPCC 205556 TaxID=3122398 RepID=UPI002FEEE105
MQHDPTSRLFPHHLKRQLRRLVTERPYQVVVGSAAALVFATGTAALTGNERHVPAPQQSSAAVAEAAPRLNEVATRGQARLAAPRTDHNSGERTWGRPDPDLTRRAAPKPPSTKILSYDYQAQTTYYNCGPAAVRNALSAAGVETTQDELAGPLGTTEVGTNSVRDTTRVLNRMVKGDPYRTRLFDSTPSRAQIDRLQADVVDAITDKRGVVVNVAGSATDSAGGWHSFPGGHYIAVVGYKNDGRAVQIADSADPSLPQYWMSTIELANWIATRGYSA